MGLELLDDRLEGVGLDRMHRLAIFHRHVFLHLGPNGVGHGDGVAVEVHGKGRDHVCLGTKTDGGAERLTGQHVCTVQLAHDHAIQQYLPVGLCLKGDVQAFVFEEAFLVGDGQRGHVGEFDKAEFEFDFFRVGGVSDLQAQGREHQQAGDQGFFQQVAAVIEHG